MLSTEPPGGGVEGFQKTFLTLLSSIREIKNSNDNNLTVNLKTLSDLFSSENFL